MQNTYSRTSLLVVAIGLLAVITLSQILFKGWRLDLTENRLYTLSDGTQNVLDKIEEPVTLYFFYNREAAEDVPPLQAYATRVQEFLEELSLRGGEALRLELIAPEPFSPEEDRAVELGVEPVPLNEAGDNLYFGLAGTNTVDDVETIAFFQPNRESSLEYDVVKLIYSLANPVKPKVGLMSRLDVAGGFNPQQMQPTPPWMAVQQLREFFDVVEIDPEADSIADDIEMLVLIHPANLSDATSYAIDQFVLGGGKALVFVDPFAESAAQKSMGAMAEGPSPNSDLKALFTAWGLELTGDVLGDGAAALQVQTRQNQRPVYHLAMLGLDDPMHFAADDVITQDLQSINLGVAGILQPLEDAQTTFTPLIRSSDQAAPIPAFRIQPQMNPASLQSGFAPTGESYTVAARVQGPAKSAFADGPPQGVDSPDHRAESDGDINVIAVADTDMLTDRFWVQVQNFLGQSIATPFASNGDFLVNAVDNLLGSSDVIGIKSRAGFARPFTRIEAMEREADAEFRKVEEALQAKLRETEAKLSELQAGRSEGNVLSLTPEQREEIERFREQQLATRKELREVRHNLNKDIEALQATLKFANTGLVPILIIVVALVLGLRRRQGGLG